MTKWEYSCTVWNHKSDDNFAIESTQVRLDAFSRDGWELIQIYKGIAYFKRMNREWEQEIIKAQMGTIKSFSCESVQDGYVIFAPGGKKMPGYEVEKLLNQYVELDSKEGI